MDLDGATDAAGDPVRYQIVVGGRLDEQWSDWLSGMAVGYAGGVTTLTGPLADQPALLGILVRLGNLNLTLISVRRLDGPARAHPRAWNGSGEDQEEA